MLQDAAATLHIALWLEMPQRSWAGGGAIAFGIHAISRAILGFVTASLCTSHPQSSHVCRKKATGAALGDLSSLADALGVAEKDVIRRQQQQAKGLGAGGAKARKRLASKETVRLQKVVVCFTYDSMSFFGVQNE